MAKKTRTRGTPPPKDETKEARFIRVCTARVRKAVKAISNIGNCASSNYSYTPEQLVVLNQSLITAMDDMQAKFQKKVVTTSEFSFTPPE